MKQQTDYLAPSGVAPEFMEKVAEIETDRETLEALIALMVNELSRCRDISGVAIDCFFDYSFARRFTSIVARALVGLGRKPSYTAIARFVTNIEPLLIDYYHLWLNKEGPEDWKQAVQTIEGSINDKSLPMALRGRDYHAIALVRFAKERGLYDPVADGLRSVFEGRKGGVSLSMYRGSV